MNSRQPYFIRAMHEWMCDNGLTPLIIVDASSDRVRVPREQVQDGKIVLNCSYEATQGLTLGNEQISFRARFGGVARDVSVPVGAVRGIYARETGEGMLFEAGDDGPDAPPDGPGGNRGTGPAHLKVVK